MVTVRSSVQPKDSRDRAWKAKKGFFHTSCRCRSHSGMPALAKLTVHPVGREGELGQVKMLQSPTILLPCQFCSIWLAVGPPGSPGPAELSCWVGIMARSSSCVPAVPAVPHGPWQECLECAWMASAPAAMNIDGPSS